MPTDVTSYNAEGMYHHQGNTECQAGRLYLLGDWLLYGDIVDSRQGTADRSKRIIGRRFGEDGALGLLKLPEDPHLRPVAWYLKPTEGSHNRDVLSGSYSGTWNFADNVPQIDWLHTLFSRRGSTTRMDVDKLSPVQFEMGFFSRGFLEEMEPAASKSDQIGMLRIDRL